jgi:T-complex protein 1 subunit eta
MSSKLIHSEKPFFSKMVVDAVLSLDQDDLDESLIGVKKIPGGGMQDSLLIRGVSFKKTFTYAGAEQQPKSFTNPLILSLNVELELKAEKDNAEVRVDAVADYQAIVDAEWEIIYRKLQEIENTGAKVVLSKLPIGDLATQWFADRDIFCAGRVPATDLRRVVQAVGGSIQSTTSDIGREHLGTCGKFEERQIGGERYNVFEECPKAKTCTMILRGGAEQFIEEVERSLHDAVMVVKRAVKNGEVVAGGGAVEVRAYWLTRELAMTSIQMDLSAYMRKHALSIPGKLQLVQIAFAKALEIIPRQICDNAGLDSTDILNKLRMRHSRGEKWVGVDVDGPDGVRDNLDAFVWEPSLVKINAISSAVEAACLIVSVDETVRNPQSEAVSHLQTVTFFRMTYCFANVCSPTRAPERHLALHNERYGDGVGAEFHGDELAGLDRVLALFIHEIVIARIPPLRMVYLESMLWPSLTARGAFYVLRVDQCGR